MKIAFITEYYAPEVGGVATSATRISRSLAALGHEVMVFTWDMSRDHLSEDNLDTTRDGTLEINRIAPHHRIKEDGNLLTGNRRRAVNQMIDSMEGRAPDIVIGFYIHPIGLLAAIVARHFQVPLVQCVRGNDVGSQLFSSIGYAHLAMAMQAATTIVPVNRHLARWVNLGFPEHRDKVEVIPNSTTVWQPTLDKAQARNRILEQSGWPQETLIAVFIGDMREKKGSYELLKAMRKVAPSYPLRLLVVGKQPHLTDGEGAYSWNMLRKEGYLHCTGMVSGNGVREWCFGGDLLLFPSKEDGMANGLLEGMGLGLCPIASKVFDDVVNHNVNGFLLPRVSIDHIREALVHAMENRDRLPAMGASAKQHIEEHHRPEHEAQAYERLFLRLISNGFHH